MSGALEPADQAQAAFQVSGTVASVSVTQGQQVTAGQTLATLDPTLAQNQVAAAQAALTAAQAKLAADESGQATSSQTGSASASSVNPAATAAMVRGAAQIVLTSTTPSTGPGRTGGPGPAGGTATGGATPPSGGSGTLASDQQAVVTAQHTVDVAMQTASADLAQVRASCAGPQPGSPTGTAPSTTDPTTTTTTTTTVPASTTTTSSSTTTTRVNPTGSPATSGGGCTSALSQAQAAEEKVATDQMSLASAENTLARILSAEAASSGSSGGGASSSSPANSGPAGSSSSRSGSGFSSIGSSSTKPSSVSQSSGSRSTGSASTSQPTDTPEQLASDQATIDSDQASLTEAEQSLAAATLTSPISGTVASVSIMPGQTVSAGSTTAVITVINSSGYQSAVSLTTSQVQEVKVGDTADLTIDGVTGRLQGVVSAIGPVDVSNSSYTYPVTVALTSPTGRMAVGSATQTQIDVARTAKVLAVPTSAVHTAGTNTFVYVEKAGKEVRQRVTVGVVGPAYTQIRSGLTKSQTVILADPSQAVPASNTNLTAGRGGFGRFLRGATGIGGAGGAVRNLVRGG